MSTPDKFPITATIITLNEESSLPRAIKSVSWADEILVVDSGSTDKTVEVAKELGARVIFNAWPGYGQQKNFAQERAKNEWVLNIDADEEVPENLSEEIFRVIQQNSNGQSALRGFYLPRKTFYMGQWIRHGGWYPNYLVRLANKNFSKWTEPNVHEALEVKGETAKLKHPLHHYTFSSIEDQILTNLRYSKQGFRDLFSKGQRPSLIKLFFKPLGKFIETYLLKKGFLDGLPGLIISVNAAHSMFLKYAYLYEVRLEKKQLKTDS